MQFSCEKKSDIQSGLDHEVILFDWEKLPQLNEKK